MAELNPNRCEWVPCGIEYVPSVRWQRFCSNKCRMSHANARRKAAMELLGDAPLPSLAVVSAFSRAGAST